MNVDFFIEKAKANLRPEELKYIEFSKDLNKNGSISVNVIYYNRIFVSSPVKSLLLRYEPMKKVPSRVRLAACFEKFLKTAAVTYTKGTDGMLVVDDADFENHFDISTIRSYIYALFPSEPFGCCGKYNECSDARACLHDDLIYASGCMYRANLESGKIFYGKNANTGNFQGGVVYD